MNDRVSTPAEHDLDMLRSYAATRAKPTKAALADSALAWLSMAQNTVGKMGANISWLQDSPERANLVALRDELRGQLEHIRTALTESGATE